MCESCKWREALEVADAILLLLPELPEKAEEFVESVEGKVESIRGWVEDNEHVTEKQESALDNMLRGAEKWSR